MILDGDLETYCDAPLKHGTYQYAEKCEVMLFFYGVDDGPVKVWDMTGDDPMPDDLAYALEHADEIVFQNSGFDRTVFRLAKNSHPLMRKAGAQIHRWRDTMVQALTHSLPGGLEKLGDVLKVDQDKRKLEVGKQLIRLFCIPPAKNLKRGRATKETHPIEWAQFVEYGVHDILAMREIYKKCPKWNYKGSELALWHLDQKINDRGFCVDLELANAAIKMTVEQKALLKTTTQEMTGGVVESATKRDQLLEYILADYGVALPNLQKDTLERRIEDPDLPIELRDLLAIRLQASNASTAKYQALVRGVSSDGRLRGTLQFCGASRTGRWAGRTFQPQNLSRVPKYLKSQWEFAASTIKNGSTDLIYDNPIEVLGSLVRGVIVAPPGKKLVVGDLANIEGRMAAWLAGENWKLDKFREYDDGTGPDLYKVAYAKSFAVPVDTVDGGMQRQIGKVQELMLQYQGRVGAFITGAATYRIDLDEMTAAALPTLPDDVLREAAGFYDWTVKKRRSTYGLPRDVFVACESLTSLWRQSHPAIVSFWPELEENARKAINHPGQWFPCRRVAFRRDGAWLKCKLPSGRLLCYPSPQVDDKGKISYMGIHQYTRAWSRISTYGGKFLEQCCQAASRDILAANMPLVDEAGYEIVLSVHDELICETPDTDEFTADGLCSLMAAAPDWAEGLPLASAGFSGARYKKD